MLTFETVNLVQRSTAIIALFLLALQIYTNTSKKMYIYLTYLFVFIQPPLILLARYMFRNVRDPFYMYTDLCVLCDGKAEYIINFMRITFYAVSVAVFALIFKNMDKWLMKNYKKFEYLYIIGFYSLSIYLYNTGPLVRPKSFISIFWLCQLIVFISIFKMLPKILKPMSKI